MESDAIMDLLPIVNRWMNEHHADKKSYFEVGRQSSAELFIEALVGTIDEELFEQK